MAAGEISNYTRIWWTAWQCSPFDSKKMQYTTRCKLFVPSTLKIIANQCTAEHIHHCIIYFLPELPCGIKSSVSSSLLSMWSSSCFWFMSYCLNWWPGVDTRLMVCITKNGPGLILISMSTPTSKNPAYGRHRISGPMRIVGPIQFWRVCVIYLEEKKEEEKNGAVDVSTRPRVHVSTRRLHAGAMDALHPPPVFRAPRV